MYLTINDYVICSDVKSKFYRARRFGQIPNDDQLQSWNTVPIDEKTFCLSSCDENGKVFYMTKHSEYLMNDEYIHSGWVKEHALKFTNIHGRFVFDNGQYCLVVDEKRGILSWSYYDLYDMYNDVDEIYLKCCVSLKHNMDNNDNNLGDYVLK